MIGWHRWLVIAVAALAGSVSAADRTVDDARLKNAAAEPQNWLTHGGTWLEQHYSQLKSITPENVSQLAPAWFFEFGSSRNQESEPLVADGMLYVTAAWSKLYALDPKRDD